MFNQYRILSFDWRRTIPLIMTITVEDKRHFSSNYESELLLG